MSARVVSADEDGGAAGHDDAAMRCRVAEACGRGTADLHGARAGRDAVGRADADGRIPQAGRGNAANQHGGRSRREHRATDVRYARGDLRTNMHVEDARGGVAHGWVNDLAIGAGGQVGSQG